uniref:Uncharacterized protein n=1 Tax=Oryza punctata TaxID=4537 RepID=A0A0E0MIZ5_ORYPU
MALTDGPWLAHGRMSHGDADVRSRGEASGDKSSCWDAATATCNEIKLDGGSISDDDVSHHVEHPWNFLGVDRLGCFLLPKRSV